MAQRITSRTANRAFVGLPLCRDDALLESSAEYAKMVYQGAVFIHALPESLKPILGPAFGLLSKGYRKKCMDVLVPAIRTRLEERNSRKDGQEKPNDAMEWIIEHSARQVGSGRSVEAALVAERLLILQLVSTYTVALTLAPLIVNIYSHPRSAEFVAGLREECERVSAAHGGSLSSREAIDQLYRVDSAVRESMRVSPFAVINPLRLVGKGGLTYSKEGVIPAGTTIGLPIQEVQHDPENYENPLEFDPFRFSRPFEGLSPADPGRIKQELGSKATKTFLPFSYGKHVCPGRWYAMQTLKIVLSHLVINYDVEFVGQRQKTGSFLSANMPPERDEIRVVRRKGF